MTNNKTIIGPFDQILTMDGIPQKGAVKDDQLQVITDSSILIEGNKILTIGKHTELKSGNPDAEIINLPKGHVVLPGYIDCHTHICFGGNRARDYALRNAGSSYLEIAAAGGGIWDTVTQTRQASKESLINGIVKRANKLLNDGITTIEVKSGYGLSVEEELKMLYAIKEANEQIQADLIPTCLAAHIVPKEFKTSPEKYVQLIINELFPILKEKALTNRIDAFVEEEAYTEKLITPYLEAGRSLGFDITVHADQFHPKGSELAIKYGAVSADHLEASTNVEINMLSKSDVIPVALPGASIGLGCAYTPARKLLDADCSLAIASDYNPGSAPMGDLITQASILGTFEKLSNAEILSGITFRAAAALKLDNVGKIADGFQADMAIYATDNYQNILYYQGQMKPSIVVSKGKIVKQ